MDDEWDRRRRDDEDRDDRLRREDDDRRVRIEVDQDLDYMYGTDDSANVWDAANRKTAGSGPDGIFARWGNVLRGRR